MDSPSSHRLSRRSFIRSVSAAAGVLAGSAWLGGCAPPAGTPPAQPAGGPAPAPGGARPASGGPPLKIGLLLPYSGVYTVLGESITNGMQLYFESVGNTAGGRSITLIKEDEGATGDEGLRKARKLIELDQVDLMAGVVSTAIAYAIRDLVHDSKTIFICANAGGNELTRSRKSPYIFRTSFTNAQPNIPMGEYVYKNVGRRVMITAADYAAGHEHVGAFKAGFLAVGGEIVGELYPPFPNTDYAAYLTQIAQARPDATYSFYAGSDAVNFVKQYAEFGLNRDIRLCGAGFMLEEDVLPAQGPAALRGISGLHWALTLDTPENRAFVQAYRQRFNKDPDVYAMQGYDTGRVIVEAINQTQGDTSNKDRLVEVITGIKFTSPRGPFEFDPETHNVVQNIYAREVREVGGKLTNVVIETFPMIKDRA
ncbi:MAG TPA: ABC transporter substrate-binding protein [Chloroflexota bacterium]|nr:ABC transporter substrate-binding protein [Chloroflexota bacterium]